MKKVAGTLKIAQAEFRELEAFSKFSSDLDPATKAVLEKGIRNLEILKQHQFSPMKVETTDRYPILRDKRSVDECSKEP